MPLSGFPQGHSSYCCLSVLKILHFFQLDTNINTYMHIYAFTVFISSKLPPVPISVCELMSVSEYLFIYLFMLCYRFYLGAFSYEVFFMWLFGFLSKCTQTYPQNTHMEFNAATLLTCYCCVLVLSLTHKHAHTHAHTSKHSLTHTHTHMRTPST